MRAIEIGSLEEIAARPGATATIRSLPSPLLTKPACRFRVRREAEET
jgi:hypothetical protein